MSVVCRQNLAEFLYWSSLSALNVNPFNSSVININVRLKEAKRGDKMALFWFELLSEDGVMIEQFCF